MLFPISIPSIEPDVMNPHYQPYYGESPQNAKTPPADYHNPIPVFFLTVKDCAFQFMIGVRAEREKSNETMFDLKLDSKNIEGWLIEALTQRGIGAKTAVGYGYLNEKQK